MLAQLHIRRVAIIDNLELEVDDGLTALTGETGAGKSILLDALGLVLGGRARSDVIQRGADRAEISARFSIDTNPSVRDWLTAHDLDDDDDCLLRRVIASTGKSRASINGRPVAAQLLRELGEQLVTIHGQHEHQALSQASEQRSLLDRFSGSRLVAQVHEAFDAWQLAHERHQSRLQQQRDRQQRLDLLQFQLQEFDALDLRGLDIANIESEHRWLANAERLMALGHSATDALENPGASALLNQAHAPLTELVGLDERLREALDLLESAQIQCDEAASLVRHYVSKLEHDDARLAWLDEQLAQLHQLARKHMIRIEELADHELTLRDELGSLQAPEDQLDALQRDADEAQSQYRDLAARLSKARQQAARRLAKEVTRAMQTVAMSGGVFRVDIDTDTERLHRTGQDTILFRVSPNPGNEPAPLARVASGGELSRISLCLQLATLDTHSVPTLIFDEVDAGIGGAAAEAVGQLLRQVGQQVQVLCVTHLPQVAARAHHHVRVSKQVSNGQTSTQLSTLDAAETRDEIARMLGGARLTKKSRQHAQEMLDGVLDNA